MKILVNVWSMFGQCWSMAANPSKSASKAVDSDVIHRKKVVSFPAPASNASTCVSAAETTDLACIYEII